MPNVYLTHCEHFLSSSKRCFYKIWHKVFKSHYKHFVKTVGALFSVHNERWDWEKKIKSKETNIKRGQNIEKNLSQSIREHSTNLKNNRKLVESGGK